MTISKLKRAVLLLLLLPLLACGGGGGGTPTQAAVAQRVELTVGLQGSGTVGAVQVEITLPQDFALALEIDDGGNPTGAGFASLMEVDTITANYIPETGGINGQFIIIITRISGFAANSDLFKISRVYPAGASLPTIDDFEVFTEAFQASGDSDPMAEVTAKISLMTISHTP